MIALVGKEFKAIAFCIYLPPVLAAGQGLGALSVLAGRLHARTPAAFEVHL